MLADSAPGLRRWTAQHPEWREEVASFALDSGEGLVLFDPIDPPRELRRPDHVLLTVYWHARSTAATGARRVWAPTRSAQPLRNRGVTVTDPFRPGDELPAGIVAYATPRVSEVVYWLPEQRSLVVGDVLLGAGAKPRASADALRLCPESWLGRASHADLRDGLRPLLDLQVQRVLVSHGAPVLRGGRRALARALAA